MQSSPLNLIKHKESWKGKQKMITRNLERLRVELTRAMIGQFVYT